MSLFRLATVALASTLAFGSASAFELTVTGFATATSSDNVSLVSASWLAQPAGQLGELRFTTSGVGAPVGALGLTYRADLGPNANSFVEALPSFGNATQDGDYTISSFSATKTQALDRLWTAYGNITQTGSSDTKRNNAVSFQLAVWEILNDVQPVEVKSGLVATRGNFFAFTGGDVSTSMLNQADTMVTAAYNTSNPILFNVQRLASNHITTVRTTEVGDHSVTTTTVNNTKGYADLLLVTAVPEPSALLLMASGICAIGFVGRRRLRERA